MGRREFEELEEIEEEQGTRETVAQYVEMRRGDRPTSEELDRLKKLIDFLVIQSRRKQTKARHKNG